MLPTTATAPPQAVGGPVGDATPVDLVADRVAPLPAALPVAVELRGRLADAVRRTVEGQLGWQPVDAATAELVPPAVRLVDVAVTSPSSVPTVLLVSPDDPPAVAAEAARRVRPQAVVGWPDDRGRLVTAVTVATASPRATGPTAAVLHLGAAGGGVGTTTLALAIAGISAWRGRATLVTSGDAVLVPPGTPTIDPAALAAPDLWSRATPLVGVPDARAVRTTAPPVDVAVADPSVEVLVVDAGVADDVDVLVCRPDAAALAALERTSAAAVVVVGEGPVAERDLTRAIGGRRRVDVPRSARVARAAVVGRVPAALPGRLVRSLLPLVPAGDRGG